MLGQFPVDFPKKNPWELLAQDFFYSLDALPVTQPTVSKHWRDNKNNRMNQSAQISSFSSAPCRAQFPNRLILGSLFFRSVGAKFYFSGVSLVYAGTAEDLRKNNLWGLLRFLTGLMSSCHRTNRVGALRGVNQNWPIVTVTHVDRMPWEFYVFDRQGRRQRQSARRRRD